MVGISETTNTRIGVSSMVKNPLNISDIIRASFFLGIVYSNANVDEFQG
jgi:hypothetical protein